jgi:hypothetical protein
MTLRSSSAIAPMIVNIDLPMGVLVSSASWQETKPMPSVLKSTRARTNCSIRAREPIEAPHQHYVELAAARVSHHGFQTRGA